MLTQNIVKSKKYRRSSGPKAVICPLFDTFGLQKANHIWCLSHMTASMTASKKAVIGCHRLSWAVMGAFGPLGAQRGLRGAQRGLGPLGASLALHGTSAT